MWIHDNDSRKEIKSFFASYSPTSWKLQVGAMPAMPKSGLLPGSPEPAVQSVQVGAMMPAMPKSWPPAGLLSPERSRATPVPRKWPTQNAVPNPTLHGEQAAGMASETLTSASAQPSGHSDANAIARVYNNGRWVRVQHEHLDDIIQNSTLHEIIEHMEY